MGSQLSTVTVIGSWPVPGKQNVVSWLDQHSRMLLDITEKANVQGKKNYDITRRHGLANFTTINVAIHGFLIGEYRRRD